MKKNQLTRRSFLKAGGALGTLLAVGPGVALAEDAPAPDAGGAPADDGAEGEMIMPGEQLAGWVPAAEHDIDECFEQGVELNTQLLAEGAVLLKNKDSVLPLAQGAKVTILGAMSYNYRLGGGGSGGGSDDEYTVMMNDAFSKEGLDVNADAWSWLEQICGGERNVASTDPKGVVSSSGAWSAPLPEGWGSFQAIHEFSADTYEAAKDTLTKDGYTDYAVVTFSRSGAEGSSIIIDMDGDGSSLTGTTYLEFSDDEKDLLAFCKQNYAHTILLLNSAAPLELGPIDSDEYNVDACIWMGAPGEAGLYGVAQLLAGTVCPSGRLVDTYAYDMTTNPTYYNMNDNKYASTELDYYFLGMTDSIELPFYQYEEGIYVGYKFYETADAVGYFDSDAFTSHDWKNGRAKGYDEVVQFPFGFGLSYTTFEEKVSSSDVKLEAHGTNSITVTVTNTGSVAGKDVVELYMDAPYQTDTTNFGIKGVGLEKAKVSLVAFAKTGTLEPGASEDVTLTFETDDLASYDNFGQGCYVLESGEYRFNVQKDAHQWGDEGSGHEPSDSVSATVASSVIYKESGSVSGASYAGARSSDKVAAQNAMDDVTAGDGNMLDGYLSRSDIAGGMDVIMRHESSEEANETISSEMLAIYNLTGTESLDHTFETYINGQKTTLTKTFYARGADMMPFAAKTPDGTDVSSLEAPVWEQTYYVVEGETDGDLPIKIVDEEPTSGSYHKLALSDMLNVPIDTEEGLAAWDKITNQTTMAEAIEVQGNSAFAVSEVASVGKPYQLCKDGPAEANSGATEKTTWWPCEPIIAATWNTDLVYEQGVAYGRQDILASIGHAYGPGMNLHRSPFGGRNFEYYSEDGFISGMIGGSLCSGIMSNSIGVFPKHCALNDGDTNRVGNSTWASEQAIRELYMRPYEIACKNFGANGIMGSLNRIGFSWFHYGMYVTMMRDEWGWQGNLITDGEGAEGDYYNNAPAMLAAQGSMLWFSIYVNNAASEACYGDVTTYPYAQQCLHDIMRHALWQYAGYHGTDANGDPVVAIIDGSASDGSASTAAASGSQSNVPLIAGGVAVAAAAAVGAGVYASRKKKAGAANKPAVKQPIESDADDEEL